MVQNKEITKEKLTNGNEENEAITIKLNGEVCNETDNLLEVEDNYLNYLLIVPSLDKNVSSRNMNLITESLSNFYTTIESKKEYPKIKEELMGDLIINISTTEKEIKESKSEIEIKEVQISEVSLVAEARENFKFDSKFETFLNDEQIGEIEVKNVENIQIKSFSLCFTKARFVPEIPTPLMFDQFLICRRCKIFFKTKKFRKMHNILNHRRKNIENGKNPEIIASIEMDKSIKRRQRIRNSVKGEPLICDLCLKSFKVKALIRSHMKCHIEEKPLHCKLCPYSGKRNYDLKKHYFIHHNPDRIKKKRTRRRKCDKCDEILENKQAYKFHVRLNHKEKIKRKPRIFKRCEKCDEAIYTKKAYKIHMKEKHAGFMYIKCERCNRRFKTNFRLKKHLTRYAETKQDCRIKVIKSPGEFVCEHCSAKFSLKSYLSLHMRKHRVYDCDHCKMSFKSQFSLKYHEFSHLDIEPKCTHCEKIFLSEKKFANHLKRKICSMNEFINGQNLAENRTNASGNL